MPAVFVHGVPETPAVWDPLIAEFHRADVVALQLPGFGCPLPDGFEATKERCAQWLIGELGDLDDIDLVTHDWGALLMIPALADDDVQVRCWATDAGNLDETFRWHDMARTWQTPGEGEAFMDGLLGASLDDRAALLTASGVPESGATQMAAALDPTMAAAILTLYRTATEIGQEWGPFVDHLDGPGLEVESMQDPFRAADRVAALAARTGRACPRSSPTPVTGGCSKTRRPRLRCSRTSGRRSEGTRPL